MLNLGKSLFRSILRSLNECFMNESSGSNIYNYGSRRDEEKMPEYRTSRKSRRRRQKKSRVDAAARFILYLLSAAVVIGLAVFVAVRLTKAGNARPEASAPSEPAP